MLFKKCSAFIFLIFISGLSITAAQSEGTLGYIQCHSCGTMNIFTHRLRVSCQTTPQCRCDHIAKCPGPTTRYHYQCDCGALFHDVCMGTHRGTCNEVHPGIDPVLYEQ
uniref:Avirulence protein AvrP123 n=1 Tax=Melampsora lini TaxID=5261 RepID=B2ZCS7_MELLI|nr:avirulence protein AvrP123 [Melampsora lini]ACD49717.1 avirulence protein AvrP123 [Melampsora lini]